MPVRAAEFSGEFPSCMAGVFFGYPTMKTHGLGNHPLYCIWIGMKSRCLNPNNKEYHVYGGRGITICEEWISDFKAFHDWAVASGYRRGLQIDRRDNDSEYSSDNCRFVTLLQNVRNKRHKRLVVAFGESKMLSEWAEDPRCCVGMKTLKSRLAYGHSAESALVTPLGALTPIVKRVRKPRNMRGEANVTSKLTDESVRKIRELYSTGTENQYSLARMFNVTQAAVWYVIHKRTWSHVND